MHGAGCAARFGSEPALLLRACRAGDVVRVAVGADAVECHEVPRAHVEAVEALERLARRRAEIGEIGPSMRDHVLVVARHRTRAPAMTTPRRPVDVEQLVERPVALDGVTERENGAVVLVEEPRRRLGARRIDLVGDVTGGEHHGVAGGLDLRSVVGRGLHAGRQDARLTAGAAGGRGEGEPREREREGRAPRVTHCDDRSSRDRRRSR